MKEKIKQLTKGMYGKEFDSRVGLFGLSSGQMRGRQIVHNGGWCNDRGEKLGWGDLSVEDFQKIKEEIPENELFIILGEADSFWNFATNVGMLDSTSQTRPEVENPGIEYVATYCRYIINRHQQAKKMFFT